MILPDFILPSRQNQVWDESGLDCRNECLDQLHFDTYPYEVEYRYNSRGFRDDEWPNSIEALKDCIWCFGDSFTVGLGSPVEHTWVNILQHRTGTRCINVSMDGASNDWMVRKINRVLETLAPRQIIVQWSYLHRTEVDNSALTDEERRLHTMRDPAVANQLTNFKNLRSKIDKDSIELVELIIPGGVPIYSHEQYREKINFIAGVDWPNLLDISIDEFDLLDTQIKQEIENIGILNNVTEYLKNKHLLDAVTDCILVEQVDFARDSHHYDYLTAGRIVDSIIGRFNNSSSW